MSTRSRQEIEVEVGDLARDVLESFEGVSYAEARASVWEHCPELYEEFCKAAPEPPAEPVVKADRPLTLADAIADAVDREADRQSGREWPQRSIEEIRADLWLSSQGQALYQLSKDRGHEEYWSARLAKSAGENDAWAILEEWRR